MRSNPEFSPRMLVAACCSALGVLFSLPAAASPVYLKLENYTWWYDVQWGFDNQSPASPTGTAFQEVFPQVSFGVEWPGVHSSSVAGSYESQQQASNDAFSFSARSSVSAEGQGGFHGPENFYGARISQKFYYLEFLVTEEVFFTGNLPLTDAFYVPETEWARSNDPEFGEGGEIFVSGSVLGPGTYRYWNGYAGSSSPSFAFGNYFDGAFAEVSGGPGQASFSSFTQLIDMRFTAVAVPSPSTLVLLLGGFGLMLLARSRRFRNARVDM